ncbi:non-ribosomal peptide synthetase [Streptacidiphilus sp. P02-A3a]|uniref:non-ribosomal peptide synthetase n=1 Tax=Streptacidiphilus sp. P02-A3a TaxID=2704468 RepID=UPI0015F7AF79|nr:non-ribosomal peptide synthetase [Streptacidiphilus sp. P02-A3a]QMU70041.1 amino acid adenylation domain-containing protein [Streptacidiphilus sp. P02-A3a]
MSEDITGFRVAPAQHHLHRLRSALTGRDPFVLRIEARLPATADPERLRQALLAELARHEVLRTRVLAASGVGVPVQVIADEPGIGGDSAADADADAPVRLSVGEPVDGVRRLALAVDPAVADLATLVGLLAAVLGRAAEDPRQEPVQYADVAEWFHQLLEEPETAGARDRWRRVLAAEPAEPDLPLRPADPTRFRPASVALPLDPELSRRVAADAAALAVTEAGLTAAAWALALGRGAGEEPPPLGVTVSGRAAEELRGAPGPYDRTVPIALPTGVRDTAGLARAVDAAVRQAADDVDVFHWDGAHAADSEPYCRFSAGHLDLSALTADGPAVTGPAVTDLAVTDLADRYDLRLLVVRHAPDRLELRLGYDTDRCRRQTAELLLGRTAAALAQFRADPATPLDGIALTTERDAELSRRHGTGEPLPDSDATVLDLIRAHVLARPDAPAVAAHDGRLDYAELDAAADSLAAALRAAGCAPGDRVALCLERGVLVPVAVLAVLRCGAAYVPLDGRNPAERLAGMVADAGATVLLADAAGQRALAGAVPELPVVDPAAAWSTGAVGEAAPVAPDASAYVIFTSGSTGRPKGVEITHRNLSHSIRARLRVYRPEPDSASLLIPTIAFDSSVAVLFGTLSAGGCLVVPAEKESGDPAALAQLAVEHAVTDVICVPSLYRPLLEELAVREQVRLRRALVVGEECTVALVARHHEVLPRTPLFNEYGPTEATIWCTVQQVAPDGTERVPIGRPRPGVRLYLVGPDGAQVPYGARGELYIGGPSVAAGYVGRPELTAERFLDDPFDTEPGARVYRTGDLVRYQPDGVLEFLGRSDRQVKIRGFRVELEEIESRLAAQPGVTAAAVLTRTDPAGATSLAAYVVLRAPATPESVRTAAERTLPAYMVPAIEALPELPSLTSGKVDYAALRQLAPARAATPYLAPRTPVEQALAEVWQQVLGVERIGVEDNFFDHGGDSIRVVQVRAQARRHGLLVQVTDLMRHRTIAALAPLVTAVESGGEPSASRAELLPESVRAGLPDELEDAWPLSSLQAGMLVHSAYEHGDRLLYHDVTTLRLGSALQVPAFESAVAELCRRHAMLRVSFDLGHAAGPLQLVHRGVPTPLRVVDLRSVPDDEQRRQVDADVEGERTTPFVLQQAPLARFVLHLLGADEYQLTFAAHHAVLDGWSVNVMLAELMDCYQHAADPSAPAPAPAPEASYGRFLALEQAALEGQDADWWARRTEDLPTVRLGGSGFADGLSEKRLGAEFGAATSDALRDVAQRAGVPLKSALLAVHLKVLAVMTGHQDVVTGLVTNGRPEDEDGSESMLGLFLNTLPLRTALPRGSWLDLLAHVFAEEREMLPHRWYPMNRIGQGRAADSLFEATFNYVHFRHYGELSTRSGLDVIDARFHGDTNLPLVTDFVQDPVSGRIELSIAFDPARYRPEFIEAMVDRYRAALDLLIAAPELPHTGAPLLSPDERTRLDAAAHGARTGPAPATLVPALAAALADAGDRTAVEGPDGSVTHARLLADARALGAAARAALTPGADGAEPVAALLLPRGVDLVTAATGCLLAGVPFVVCDPGQRPERLRAMLLDAGTGLVVAAEPDRLGAALPPGVPCRTPEQLRGSGTPGPDADPHPEALAYLVFTSGSTGRPKPVAVPHRALANRVAWSQREYPLRAEDRVLALASPVFDFAIWELFGPLLAGARTIGAPELRDTSTGLAELLRDTRATVAHLVPSLLGGLLNDPALADGNDLRLLLVGGEAFPAQLLAELRGALGCEVVHQYGPAEATIDATFHRCGPVESGPVGGPATVPIGRPVDNVTVHLLGDNLLPVPPGCPGEVFLGGAAPARGYHRRPGPTAEAFLPDPYSGAPGARLYRTGDLARLLPDGSLEFLGRVDDQVQVNGVRVEPGEVEAALYAAGQLAEAAVVALPAPGGGAQLVAHVVPRAGIRLTAEDVLDGLAGLPDALRPGLAVVHGDPLPRTASGKLDRAALRTAELPGPRTERVAPATELETRLAARWSEVFGNGEIGVTEDFFELGGGSLLALQLVARARRDGIKLTPRLIYAHRTIRALAELLSGTKPPTAAPAPGGTPAALVALRSDGDLPPFFCVHASNGSAAPYAALAAGLPRRRPFFALDAEGLAPDGPELASVPALAAHYTAQVRAQQPHGPYRIGGWSTGAAIAHEMAAQLRAAGEEVAALVLLDPPTPTRLSAPPEHALLLWLFLRDLAGLVGRPRPPLEVEQLTPLDAEARRQAVLSAIRTAGLVGAEAMPEVVARMGVFCAMVSAAAVWQPADYDGPLTLLLAGGPDPAAERLAGWRPFTTARATAEPVAGDHHGMLRQPAVAALAELLDRFLDE